MDEELHLSNLDTHIDFLLRISWQLADGDGYWPEEKVL
jgi:hypothetical protein